MVNPNMKHPHNSGYTLRILKNIWLNVKHPVVVQNHFIAFSETNPLSAGVEFRENILTRHKFANLLNSITP